MSFYLLIAISNTKIQFVYGTIPIPNMKIHTNGDGEFKNAHNVGGNRLQNKFNKNFYPIDRKGRLTPPLNPLPNSFISSKFFGFFLPIIVGMPKYLSCDCTLFKPKAERTIDLHAKSKFGPKVIADYSMLIF